MPAELALGDRAPAGRSPATVVARQTARRAIRSGALWGAVFGIFVASSALGYASAYKTAAARDRLAATFGSNAGVDAIIGPAHRIQTVAGFTAWRSLGVLGLVGAVWGLLAGTRLLRGEEDAGRWELLLAGQTTRRRAAAQALVGLGAGVGTLWAITAAVTMVVGRSSKVHVAPGAAAFFALALVCSAVTFLAAGAFASQLAATRRQAAAYAGGALGASYAVRMLADSGTGVSWLQWATPLGWVERLRPLTGPRPVALLPIVGLVTLLSVLTVHLAGTRDLGASTLPDHSTAGAHTRLLSGPTGLGARLVRPVAIGWIVSIAALALMMGLISKSAGNALSSSSTFKQALSELGGRGTPAAAYLAVAFLIIALLVALVAAGQVSAVRDEEAEGRVDHLLVRPVSRWRWLAGRLGLTIVLLATYGVVGGLFAWLGASSQNAGISFASLLDAGVNVVPPALLVLGIGTFAFGVWPRGASGVTYAVLAWSFLVELIGGIINADHWLLDTSVFHHMAGAPAVTPDWTSASVLAVLGVGLALVGARSFHGRDLTGA